MRVWGLNYQAAWERAIEMKTCLIVDTGDFTRDTACGYLKGRNFSIRAVKDSEQALTMCREKMPDVILIDDSANPAGQAFDFVRKLRSSPPGEWPFVIYCSKERDAATIGAAIWDGASDCLMKPFDADLLEFKLYQSGVMNRNQSDI